MFSHIRSSCTSAFWSVPVMDLTAQEGGVVGQVEDLVGEEHVEYPARGLQNDQARVFPRKLCNPTYISRLSTMHFNKVVKLLIGVQLGHIRKYKMEALIHMPYQLIIPMNLLEWLDQHNFVNVEPHFKHMDTIIKIKKDMVHKIFDFRGGTVPFVFSSDDPQVKSEVAELRNKYIDQRDKMPINKIEDVMLSDETEDCFVRSFAFYFISIIFSRASYCFGNKKFLYYLRDVSAIPSLNFGQWRLILCMRI